MSLGRRDLLAALAATAAASAAGCLDDGASGSAGFADWVPANDGGALAMYADVAALQRVMEAPEQAQSEFPEDPEDPVLGVLVGALLVYALSTLGLAGTGLTGLVSSSGGGSSNGTGTGDGFETTIEEYVGANDVLVLQGDVVADEIAETLTAEPEGFSLTKTFERVEGVAGFDVYEPVGGGSGNGSVIGGGSGPAVAVGGDAILVGDPDPVRATLRAHASGDSRAVDQFDDFGWLLDATGEGDLRLASYRQGGIEGGLTGGTGANATDGSTAAEGSTTSGSGDGNSASGSGDGNSTSRSGDGNSTSGSGDGSDGSDSSGEGIQRLGTPTGVAGSFSFSQSAVSASVAVAYGEMASEGREQFRSLAGASANSSSVEFRSDRLTATAEYQASFE